MQLQSEIAKEIEKNGFALWEGAVGDSQLELLKGEIEARRARSEKLGAGLRTLLQDCPRIAEFADREGQQIVRAAIGKDAWPVRAILFDKNENSNWYVRWHQDRAIPVERRIDIPGFSGWSEKDGVTHVRPPVEILEAMLSLRIHIDPCGIANGAIKFIPSSHRVGAIDSDDIPAYRAKTAEIIVSAQPGDIILMRPLILHASSKAASPDRRRVLHIEYATTHLPGGLNWARA